MRTLFPILSLAFIFFPLIAQNPITAAKEAFRKAKEDARRAGQPGGMPAGVNVPGNTPPPPATTSTILKLGSFEEIAAAAGKYDIVGIRPGDPVETAIAKLKAHNPQFQLARRVLSFSVIPTPLPYDLSAMSPSDKIYLRFTLPPNPAHVVKISRYLSFSRDNTPNQNVVVADLIAKYGKPSFDNGPAQLNDANVRELIWEDDHTGRRVTHEANNSQSCKFSPAFGLNAGPAPPQTLLMERQVAGEIETARRSDQNLDGCIGARMIWVKMTKLAVPTPDLIGDLAITTGDSALLLKANQATQDMVVAATKARDKNEQEKSLKNRPVL